MKASKWWLLRIAGGLLAFVLLLAAISIPAVHMRRAAIKPLDLGDLARVGIVLPGIPDPDNTTAKEPTEPPAAQVDLSATVPSARPEARQTITPRLTRVASEEDLRKYYRAQRMINENRSDIVWEKTYFAVAKTVEAVVSSVRPAAEGYLATAIGRGSLFDGDLATARDYLRVAVRRGEGNDYCRESNCAALAWLEADTEVATALLEASCASGDRFRLLHALNLAVLTHSDELAEHYLERVVEADGDDRVVWQDKNALPEVKEWYDRRPKAADSPGKRRP